MTRYHSYSLITTSAIAATDATFPKRIDLPDGFQPEGIANADEQFCGSIPTGAVYRRTRARRGRDSRPGGSRSVAIGLKADRGGSSWPAASTGNAYVYSARTGALIRTYTLATGNTFVNDVVVTKQAAWFTDSFNPVLYRGPLGPNGRPGALRREDGPALGRLPARGLQRERDRCNAERQDAPDRAVGHRRLFTVSPPA